MAHLSQSFICVADDDSVIRTLLVGLLTKQGYQVKAFESGTELLSLGQELENCDLIISDINMPGLSGYDICRHVRSESKFGRIPIILITGSNPLSEKATGLEVGADEFIGKPFRSSELLAKVRSLLEIRAKEILTLQELYSVQGLNHRLKRLQKYLSPNVANMLTLQSQPLLTPHLADVSVFFVDLRGFTAFSEHNEPEKVLEILSAYYTAVGKAAIKYQATFGHLAGDGIMVFFNDPNPVTEHCKVALRMALEVRESLSLQRQGWKLNGYSLDFGIGINSGEAMIGEIGLDQFSHYSVIGPVINLAARLCNAAAEGQILISKDLLDIVGLEFNTRPLGELSLKGLDHPLAVFDVC